MVKKFIVTIKQILIVPNLIGVLLVLYGIALLTQDSSAIRLI